MKVFSFIKLECNGLMGLLLVMIYYYLSNCAESVVLNRKMTTLIFKTVRVPQGSILGPQFFLVYINGLTDNSSSKAKLFADNTFLFIVGYDEKVTAGKRHKHHQTISNWAHRRKCVLINPIKDKQTVKVIFL